MRASCVVVETPTFDDLTHLLEAAEKVLVQAFVAEAPDKALCKPILHRLAGRDVNAIRPYALPAISGWRSRSALCRWR